MTWLIASTIALGLSILATVLICRWLGRNAKDEKALHEKKTPPPPEAET